jgi:protein-S-isoprenylcysteine O-methyltransferase Ste14
MAAAHIEDRGSGLALRIAFYGGILVCLFEPLTTGIRPAAVIAGFGLILVGLALRLWAEKSLGALWSTRVQVREDHFLTHTGPYRLLRHPAYLGLALFYLGAVVACDSFNGLMIFVLGVAPALAYRVTLEEAALAERFGQQYQLYASQTKRFVPFLF